MQQVFAVAVSLSFYLEDDGRMVTVHMVCYLPKPNCFNELELKTFKSCGFLKIFGNWVPSYIAFNL